MAFSPDYTLGDELYPDEQEFETRTKPSFINPDGSLLPGGVKDVETEISLMRARAYRNAPFMQRTLRETGGNLYIPSSDLVFDKKKVVDFLLGKSAFENQWLYQAGADRIYDEIVAYTDPDGIKPYYLAISSEGIIDFNSRFCLTEDCCFVSLGGATGAKDERIFRQWGLPASVRSIDISRPSATAYDRRMQALGRELGVRNFRVLPTIVANIMDDSQNGMLTEKNFHEKVLKGDTRRRVISDLGNRLANYPLEVEEWEIRQVRRLLRPEYGDQFIVELDSSKNKNGLLQRNYSFKGPHIKGHPRREFWREFVGVPYVHLISKVVHLDIKSRYVNSETEVTERIRGHRDVSIYATIDARHPKLEWMPGEEQYPAAEPFREMARGSKRWILGSRRSDEDRIIERYRRNGLAVAKLPDHEGPLRGPNDPRLPPGANNNMWVFDPIP